jgi:hypothetical protein
MANAIYDPYFAWGMDPRTRGRRLAAEVEERGRGEDHEFSLVRVPNAFLDALQLQVRLWDDIYICVLREVLPAIKDCICEIWPSAYSLHPCHSPCICNITSISVCETLTIVCCRHVNCG